MLQSSWLGWLMAQQVVQTNKQQQNNNNNNKKRCKCPHVAYVSGDRWLVKSQWLACLLSSDWLEEGSSWVYKSHDWADTQCKSTVINVQHMTSTHEDTLELTFGLFIYLFIFTRRSRWRRPTSDNSSPKTRHASTGIQRQWCESKPVPTFQVSMTFPCG